MKINEFYRYIDELDVSIIKSFSIEAIVLFAENEYGHEQLCNSFYRSFYLWEYRSIVYATQQLSPKERKRLCKIHTLAINELRLLFGSKRNITKKPINILKKQAGNKPITVTVNGCLTNFSDYIELIKAK